MAIHQKELYTWNSVRIGNINDIWTFGNYEHCTEAYHPRYWVVNVRVIKSEMMRALYGN